MATLTKLVVGVDLAPAYLARIRTEYPDLDVIAVGDQAEIAGALAGAQALVNWRLTPEQMAAGADLGWVQLVGAGVDGVLTPEIVQSDILLTNNSGVHAPNIAEHLLAMMLAFARDLPQAMRNQSAHVWDSTSRSRLFELGGQTLGVVGLGDIGQALAWRANALGMRVIGTRRHATEPPRGVERLIPADQLHELLAESDHVAICLPLTRHTRHLFGAAEFRAMRDSAFIYNIGRGPIIDQEALIAALRAGELAGAGLDVTDPEPLPADSPLWDMPNVLITAHYSGGTPRYWERAIEILLTNIGRYRRDEPLLNVVDKREGY